tara:strand:+ start:332 stop:481 length:150 start_codon:yes stop_codon:yes gene_type:complete
LNHGGLEIELLFVAFGLFLGFASLLNDSSSAMVLLVKRNGFASQAQWFC